jgi:hypothetical protein
MRRLLKVSYILGIDLLIWIVFKRRIDMTKSEIDILRISVITKGQSSKDKRIVTQVIKNIQRTISSGNLMHQVLRDVRRQYKFYDALAMWLGQSEYWTEEDVKTITEWANSYLKGEL